jgi:hypothetical protein
MRRQRRALDAAAVILDHRQKRLRRRIDHAHADGDGAAAEVEAADIVDGAQQARARRLQSGLFQRRGCEAAGATARVLRSKVPSAASSRPRLASARFTPERPSRPNESSW